MSATTVYAGLYARFLTVPGLTNIILGEPTATHKLPCLYTAFERFERPAAGSPPSGSTLTNMKYIFTHRLLIRWVDNAEAEAELLSFVNAIPFSISEDPKLGGRINAGLAEITEGIAGFVSIGGTKYRALDFTSTVLEKASRETGL